MLYLYNLSRIYFDEVVPEDPLPSEFKWIFDNDKHHHNNSSDSSIGLILVLIAVAIIVAISLFFIVRRIKNKKKETQL